MFCEKAMELVRELHRAPEGQLPAFNVRRDGGGWMGVSGGRGCGGRHVLALSPCSFPRGLTFPAVSAPKRGTKILELGKTKCRREAASDGCVSCVSVFLFSVSRAAAGLGLGFATRCWLPDNSVASVVHAGGGQASGARRGF